MDDTNTSRDGELGQAQTSTSNLPNGIRTAPLDRATEIRVAEAAARQNWQLSPIYHLPNELLDHVFELAYFASFETDSSKGKRGSTMAFVQSASLVSKRWREIVLSNPRLWSIIDIPNRLVIETCITRSKSALLQIPLLFGNIFDLEDSPEYDAYKECVPILTACIDRWQSLSYDNARTETVRSLFANPAPNLESLELDAEAGPEVEEGETATYIPDGFFHGKLPRLRKLRLLACHLPLNPSNYPNLIELSLSMIEFHDSSIFALLGVLVACPSLELVRLHYLAFIPSFSDDESHALARMAPIAIPRLRKLSIAYVERFEFAQTLLSLIHPPRSLHLRILGGTGPSDDLHSMLPLHTDLQSTLWSLLDIEELVFAFRLPPSHNVSKLVEAWHIQGVSRRGSPNNPPSPLITLRSFPIVFMQGGSEGSELEGRLFQNIGRDLRLPQLKTLKITRLGAEILSVDAFAGVLDHLPSITHLEFVSCSPGFVRTLVFAPDRRLCPLLETLQLGHSSITDEDLLAVIESRVRAVDDVQDMSLRRLVLEDCGAIDPSTIEKLRDSVEVIILS
ncbi:hypothetical protein BOTBODRAFT_608957 [Botryobasidium botryosum FD-172 SS1]|uniref:F-box domain-containing protein n=1 Tax=Botryobasidium botryosum (strain FD-172 SS1) TaxID=930990 RepID=A0A067LWC2_BOTB1|nr:hypothetical protein BOTBODRAFT_608957 [Botryobasidium botryosum FD-172 SS1]